MVSNPFGAYTTTNAAGSFNIDSTGYVQGLSLDNPAARQFLNGGVLGPAETIPMWGAVGISENIPGATASPPLPNKQLGSQIIRATTVTAGVAGSITGFSTFDQAYSMVNAPANPVPLSYSGDYVAFYRFGTGVRLPVQLDPNLVELYGSPINVDVSWDFQNQVLVPYATASVTSGTQATAATVSSGTYNGTTGIVSLTTNAAHGLLPGDTFTLSGMTGTNASTYLDGSFVATAGTTGSTLNFAVATGLTLTITGGNLLTVGISMGTSAPHGLLPGDTFVLSAFTGTGFAQLAGEWTAAQGTTGSTLNIVASSALTSITFTAATVSTGGILPVKLIELQIGKSMTVTWNGVTAQWNRQGSTGIIIL